MGLYTYEKFKWKLFYNTCNGLYSKQCQPFNENDIAHMLENFTFIKIDSIGTVAVSYLIYFEYCIFLRNDLSNCIYFYTL